jgi:hypothetical protein
MSQLDDILDYYANLLIIQYHDKPKAISTTKAIVKVLYPVNAYTENLLIHDVRDAYNVDTAIGNQLDIVGKYVGINRYYEGQSFSGYFAFQEYDSDALGNTKGFDDYDSDVSGKTLAYEDVLAGTYYNKVDDDNFRTLIKLKIALNKSNGSMKSIDDILYEFFKKTVYVVSSSSMAMTYYISPTMTELINVTIAKNILPAPMGVEINYKTSI